MANKLYVGNLSYGVDSQTLEELFAQAGTVVSAKVITDRETGRSKGFGFVEMASPEDMEKAIKMWNEKDHDGRPLRVNEARPEEPRTFGSRDGGQSKGGYDGGYNGR